MPTLSENIARLPRIAAHLILGSRDEPFLAALLDSLDGAVDTLIVNDNSQGESPHCEILAKSPFGRRRELVVDRTPFVDFATARNVCLRLHRARNAGDWVAFVDADEVHGPELRRIAARLHELPDDVDFVDGYTWHFFQSFDWYTSIERRMTFFRARPEAHWAGRVHEHLEGLPGRRVALPYVYAHYGHVGPPRRHAEKSRQYSQLGAPGPVLREDELDSIDPRRYFSTMWPTLLRFKRAHPEDARATIDALRARFSDELAKTEGLVRESQPLPLRLRNRVLQLNYDQRWRTRRLNPQARRLL